MGTNVLTKTWVEIVMRLTYRKMLFLFLTDNIIRNLLIHKLFKTWSCDLIVCCLSFCLHFVVEQVMEMIREELSIVFNRVAVQLYQNGEKVADIVQVVIKSLSSIYCVLLRKFQNTWSLENGRRSVIHLKGH